MLKLELSHQKQAINVHMRTKEPLWTKDFLWALAITLGIHLFAFVLFDIEDPSLDDYPIIQPIEVIADIGGVSQADAGTYDLSRGEEGVMSRYFLELKTSVPGLPGLPKASTPIPERLSKETYPAQYAFKKLEYTIPEPEEPIHFRYTNHPRFKLKVTGAASRLQWNGPDFQALVETLRQVPVASTRYAQFHITVDGPSGKVIASEPLGPNDPLSYQLLSRLIFSPTDRPTVDGIVEFRLDVDSDIALELLENEESVQ